MITDLPSPETIARFTVSIAPGVPEHMHKSQLQRLKNPDLMGLPRSERMSIAIKRTIANRPKRGPNYPKHPELVGMTLQERRRIIKQKRSDAFKAQGLTVRGTVPKRMAA